MTTAHPSPEAMPTHRGSCHCGAVRFTAAVDLSKGVARCNCTVCTKIAQTGAMVRPEALVVVQGEEHLATYVWGPVATRYFCRRCGVHVFARGHLPELGGDYASVNANALDEVDPNTLPVVYWDGRHDNWEGGARSTPWPIFRA